jgi:hypothetical protein
MKQSDIKVGAVYRNRGAGTTQRKVTGIGLSFRPDHRFSSKPADTIDYGVEYQQRLPDGALRQGFGDWSEPRLMWLDSFASWVGSEVTK